MRLYQDTNSLNKTSAINKSTQSVGLMSPLRQKSLENNTAVDEGGDEMLKIRYKRYLAKLNLRWNLVTEEHARISKVRFKIINF